MGFYLLGTDPLKGKAERLIELGAWEIERPSDWRDIINDQFLIAVVENGPFDAALVVFDEREWDRTIADTSDPRPIRWLVMDRDVVYDLLPENQANIIRKSMPVGDLLS